MCHYGYHVPVSRSGYFFSQGCILLSGYAMFPSNLATYMHKHKQTYIMNEIIKLLIENKLPLDGCNRFN